MTQFVLVSRNSERAAWSLHRSFLSFDEAQRLAKDYKLHDAQQVAIAKLEIVADVRYINDVEIRPIA
jgi:hypothetical protein